MFVDISEILNKKNAKLSFDISEYISTNDYKPNINEFLSPVKVEGTVVNINKEFRLTAKGTVMVLINCDRCLKNIEYTLNFDIDEIYANTGGCGEIEVFDGSIIDISSAVKKNIIFSLPMKVVCKEDCKGLCPVCGKNLNEGDCSCDTSYINPSFESLRSLFKFDEEV